jgi:hypothetical protein
MATTVGVAIDFSNGASFGYPFLLSDPNYGILGTNILADSPQDLSDITDQVIRVSTRRGRNRILSNFEVGSATITLNDPNSDFNPDNTSSPYWDPVTNSTKLLPLRKIRIWADTTLGPITYRYYIFSGYITSYDTNFYQGVDTTSTVTLQCVDGFRLLNNVATGTAAVPGCTAGQLSGTRINALLDFADFPTSLRNLDTGDSTMQADPGGNRNVLQAIQTIEQSEFGAFYINTVGETRFLDRTAVSELADSFAQTYSDTGFGIRYTNLDFAYDDQLILNDVTVTRLGGIPQQVVDASSIATYFRKSGLRSDILVETDAEALDQAQMLLVARKNATLRIDSMDLTLSAQDTEPQAITKITNDIYKLVKINKTMSGGTVVETELFIQGVQHDITPDSWRIKLLTAEPIIQAFILDSANQGILDTNALSY